MTGQLLSSPQGIFYLACALVLLSVAVLAVVVKPVLALWALGAVFATEVATPIPLDMSLLKAGSTHIYPLDVLSVVMLLATVIFLIQRPPPARIMLPLSVAGAMFAINLYLGISEFGLRHATNESREWLYFFVTSAFVIAAGPWTQRFWRPWFALALSLVGLAWLGLARYGLHPVTSQIIVNGRPVDPRPLTAAGAMAVAFALIALLGSHTITLWRKVIFAALLVSTLILVQQRTVWAVLATVFLIWGAASLHQHSTARHKRLATAGVALLGAAALVAVSGVATGSVLGRSLAETTAKHSTFEWRLIGWSDLLHSDHSPAAIALGLPFGTGYRRSVLGTVTNVAPHSLYVAALLRIGLIGLSALVVLYSNVLKRRREAAAALGVSPLTVVLLLVAMVVFSITYEPGFLASSVTCGLLAWESQRGREPATEAVAGRPTPLILGGS